MSALLSSKIGEDLYASRICLSRFGIKLNPIQSLSLGHCVLYGDPLSVIKKGQFFSKENR